MSDHKLLGAMLRPFFRKGSGARFSLPDCLGDESRILCIDAGGLCDVLFHMPLLTAIRRRYPGTAMDFLMPEKHAPLVVPSGMARQCLIYKPGQLNPWRPSFASLLKQAGAGGYDMAFVMAHEAQPALEMVALASGAALRYGPSHDEAWPNVNFELRAAPERYLGDRLRHAAPFFGFDVADLKPKWPLPMDKVRQMAQQVHFHKPNARQMLVGIDPGRTLTGEPASIEAYQAVARALAARLECRLIPLSDPEDRERTARFEVLLSNVPSGLSRDTLLEVVLLLSQCDLFVGGNTELFHFAVAMGVPAVGLFTAADGACWRPGGRARVRVLDLADDGRIDADSLLAAVEAVAGDRRRAASTAVAATPVAEGGADGAAPSAGGPARPAAPASDAAAQ